MKKLILLTGITFCISGSIFAQKSNVNAAQNKLYDPVDPQGAIESILPALEHADTKDDPKTWFVAGNSYYTLGEQELKEEILDQNAQHKLVAADAFSEAIKYFKETRRLEQIPNEKGKIKERYKYEIADKLRNTLNAFLAAGIVYFTEKHDYKKAIENFSNFIEVQQLDVFSKETLSLDSTNNQIIFTIAEAAQLDKNEDLAIKTYESLMGKNYEEEVVYERLVFLYQAKKDEEKFLTTVNEGISKFPGKPVFIQLLINYYIEKGETEKAINYINAALEREPDNIDYQYSKAILYENLGNFDEALVVYEGILAKNQDHYLANIGVGTAYFVKAEAAYEKAQKINDQTLYEKESENAKKIYKKAFDYYSKAESLNPGENPELEKRIRQIKIKAQLK